MPDGTRATTHSIVEAGAVANVARGARKGLGDVGRAIKPKEAMFADASGDAVSVSGARCLGYACQLIAIRWQGVEAVFDLLRLAVIACTED
jgi:hypothetical protein